MCSVICRVAFEFISLSIQLENISSKPKMNTTRLCKVKLANFLNNILKGEERWQEAAAFPSDEALPRPGPSKHRTGGLGQGTAAASPGAELTRICHICNIFHLQTSLEVSAYPFYLPGGRVHVGKEQIFTGSWFGGNLPVSLENGWKVCKAGVGSLKKRRG